MRDLETLAFYVGLLRKASLPSNIIHSFNLLTDSIIFKLYSDRQWTVSDGSVNNYRHVCKG